MATVGSRTGQVTVRVGENPRIDEESRPEDGKVENGTHSTAPRRGVTSVVKKWLVYEDRVLASQVQDEEFRDHYNKNRQHRRTVRDDIPLAKTVHTEEEARAQYERMNQLQEQQRLAERDAELARELQTQMTDSQRDEQRRKQLHDQAVTRHLHQMRQQPQSQYSGGPVVQDGPQGRPKEMARHMQERERRFAHNQTVLNSGPSTRPQHQPDPAGAGRGGYRGGPTYSNNYMDLRGRPRGEEEGGSDDYQRLSEAVGGPTLASLNRPGYDDEPQSPLSDEFDEEALEAEDRDLAMRLQREEEERYERKKQQRALAKERKRLERLINQSQMQERGELPVGSGHHDMEDEGDFSDFYIPPDPNMPPDQRMRLQEEQDAELARLMQDQEKRTSRSDVLQHRLRQIESQDSELARIVQEEENLKAKRRNLKHQQKLLQQQRELAERLATQSQHGTGRSQSSSVGGASASGSAPRPTQRSASYQATGSNERPNAQIREAQNNLYGAADRPPPQSAGDGRRPGINHDIDRHADMNLHSNGPGSAPNRDNHQQAAPQRPSANASNNASSSSPGQPRLPRTSAAPPASARQAKIPINLPNRMMHNTDIDMRQQHASVVVTTDIPAGGREGRSPQNTTPPPTRRDIYAERPAGRGGYSPNRDRDMSPPGPALPERRYRDDPEASRPSVRPQLDINGSQSRPHPLERSPGGLTGPNMQQQSRHGGPPGDMYGPHTHQSDRLQPPTHQGGRHPVPSMPPYREPNPPPYQGHRSEISDVSPSSPRSAETHYDAPWDMSQLESQLLRDASMNQGTQPIVPRQVSPPGRRGEPPSPQHRSPPVTGPNGRPLIEHNEDGGIVMNVAEMLDPTYSRRQQSQRSSIAERPGSQGFDSAMISQLQVHQQQQQHHHQQQQLHQQQQYHQQHQQVPADADFAAVAGHRRASGKNGRQAGKRESCKQQ